MYRNSIYTLAFTAAATVIAGCDGDYDPAGNLVDAEDIHNIIGTHTAIFTPAHETDQYGARCKSILGNISISDATETTPPSLTAFLTTASIDQPQNEEAFDLLGIGSTELISAMLNRNGTIESAQFLSLGDWGTANVEDIPIELFEEYDLSDFETANNSPNLIGFRGSANALSNSIVFSGSAGELNEQNPGENNMSISGNVFHGGEWRGPLGYQGTDCHGTWEIILMDDVAK